MSQGRRDGDAPDDAHAGGEEDELFAAVTAAISRPPRRESETFLDQDPEPGPEPEPDEEPEPDVEPEPASEDTEVAAAVQPRDTRYDNLFYPAADEPAADEPGDDGGDDGRGDDGGDDGRGDDGRGDDGRGDDDFWSGGDQPRKRHRGRNTVLGVLVLVGAAYVAGYFLTGARLPANATVAGVDVSGSTPAAARATLTRELTPRTERPIQLTRGDKEFQIASKDAGLGLDVDASVDAVGGVRSWDPRDMVGLVFGEHPHDAVVTTEPSEFNGLLGTVGDAVDQEVVEAQITFPKSTPKARNPEAGEVLDRVALTAAIKDAYVGDGKPIEVATKVVQPAVDQDGLDAAMDGIATTAVSGPVAIKVGDKDVDLPVSAFAPALVIRVEDREMLPYIDPEELAGPLTSSTTGIGKKAVDATVRIRGGKPVVVPGKAGVGLQPEEMSTKLLPAIAATGDERAVTIEAKVVEPEFTTADAKALKITERISEFETDFPYAEYRNVNQGRAAAILNGTIIKAGDTFSFNDIVGERTQANGFVTGTVINGGVFREELGGGVSQVATTTYNAAFFGGMGDTEHHPHAFYISRYPVGREATVYFGNLDLRWKNTTKYGVLVRATVDPSAPGRTGKMRVELWSTKVWDKVEASSSPRRNARKPGTQYDDSDRCVAQSPVAGFDIDIVRSFIRDGKTAKTETDTAVYQAADKVVCGKKPKADD